MIKLSFLAALLPVFAAAALAADARRVPVLLELFTSEGCSSCPPADRLLEVLDQKQPVPGAELVVLSEHVDYWDRLGWKDPFSSAQFTLRQQEYGNKFSLDGVYTPQLVVDGRFPLVGSDGPAAVSAIQKAIREPKLGIAISDVVREANRITAKIGMPAAPKKGVRAILYVAIADNRVESHVARGENSGHLLAHVAVTRVMKQVDAIDLDQASTKEIALAIPPGADGSRLIAFLEDPRSGHVLGVAFERLPAGGVIQSR